MSTGLSRRTALAMIGSIPLAIGARADERTVRFGLTAVVVRENLDFFDRWRRYLELRLDRPVRFVQRRSYREVMELLATGEIDFAWICGYPYVRRRDPEYLDLLAIPVFDGEPRYRSYIIVHRDSPYRSVADLGGKVFAYSDPDSNSGYLAPRSMLTALRIQPDAFFRLTFFTYNHAETVEAVARRVADGGAVDSYVWEYLKRNHQAPVDQTAVIDQSDKFGFPPLVARRSGDAELRRRMQNAVLGMREDVDGRALLAELALDGFIEPADTLYDGIRDLEARLSGGRLR